jgi:hypothetical protein
MTLRACVVTSGAAELPSSTVEKPRLLLVWRRLAHNFSRPLECLGLEGEVSFTCTYLFSRMSPTLDMNTWMSLARGGDGCLWCPKPRFDAVPW